jgi:hypothetical protein
VTPVDFPVFLDTTPTRDSWSDDALGSANGFCETCHGDIQDDGPAGGVGKLHSQHKFDGNQACTDCHKHNDNVFSFNLDASAATCGDCHGFPPYKSSRGDRAVEYGPRDFWI